MRLKNDTENFAASFNITPPYQMRVIHSVNVNEYLSHVTANI